MEFLIGGKLIQPHHEALKPVHITVVKGTLALLEGNGLDGLIEYQYLDGQLCA